MINAVDLKLVSIIVPVYNVEKYLVSCIESILKQSYQHLEIILVDDGSTDQSNEICNDYQEKYKNILVIHQKNGGLSDARNAGIRAARGEFISLVDGDDIIHPLCIEKLMHVLVANHADISNCLNWRFYDRKEKIFLHRDFKHDNCNDAILYSAEQALIEILQEGKIDISVCGKLYKAALFKDIFFPIGDMFEDWATTYKLVGNAKRIVHINYAFYGYRMRTGSITHIPFHSKMLDIVKACEEFCNYVKEKCPACTKAISYRKAKAATILLERIASSENPEAFKEITVRMKEVIKAELSTVMADGNIQLSQKIKIFCGAYSIRLLKFVSVAYEKLYYLYDMIHY